MDVILLERIGRLGQMGDVVKVKDGYARNFLLPQGRALRATKSNMERFETDRTQLEARNLEAKKEAEGVATKVDGKSFIIIRQAGDTGQLYGSVTTRDIAELVTKGGLSIERRQILLDRPIKALGVHTVRLSLHPEVQAGVGINVARTEVEAGRQARGEDVTANRGEELEDEEEAISADEVFEDEALAKEAKTALEEAEETAVAEESVATKDVSPNEEEGKEV